jgi:hypothetical protein
MKIKNLLAVVLESLVVFALTLPVMAQSTTESTTTRRNHSPHRPRAPPPQLRRNRQRCRRPRPGARPTPRRSTNTIRGNGPTRQPPPPRRTNWGESVLMFPGRRRDRAFDGAPLKLFMLGWDFRPRWRNATPKQNDVWTIYPEELLWDIGAGYLEIRPRSYSGRISGSCLETPNEAL